MIHTSAGNLMRYSSDELQQMYDEIAPAYNQVDWINNYLLRVKFLRRRLFSQAHGRVLDVAAGTGSNFPFLPSNCQITAVDVSSGMMAQACEQAEQLGMDVSFELMDAEALDFPNGTFDTVVSSLSTCTFPNPVVALQEMARVCRSSGNVLLLEHGRSSWPLIAFFQDHMAHRHFAELGCRWNQQPLALVRTAGLTVVEAQHHRAGIFHLIKARPTSAE